MPVTPAQKGFTLILHDIGIRQDCRTAPTSTQLSDNTMQHPKTHCHCLQSIKTCCHCCNRSQGFFPSVLPLIKISGNQVLGPLLPGFRRRGQILKPSRSPSPGRIRPLTIRLLRHIFEGVEMCDGSKTGRKMVICSGMRD